MKSHGSVSAWRLLSRDYTLVTSYAGVSLFWIALFGVSILQGETRGFLLTALTMTLLLLGTAVYRHLSICRLLRNGRNGTGEVRRLIHQGFRWRVLFSYSLDGRDYSEIHAFVSFRKTTPLHRGARVRIKIDPKQPGRALIPFLFE